MGKDIGKVKLVGGILLMVGMLITGAGGYFYWSTESFLQNCLRTSGKVIELRKPPMARYYTPVVQFETAEQKRVTAVCKTGSNPPAHQVSDSVTVLYRASSPEDITLEEPLELWLLPGILGGIGLIFFSVGGALLIFSRKRA